MLKTAWSSTPDKPLDDGEHTITAYQRDDAGNVSETTTVTFTIENADDGSGGNGPGGDGAGNGSSGNGSSGNGSVGPGSGGLASTGQDLGVLGAVGIALLLGGAFLTRRTNRRA